MLLSRFSLHVVYRKCITSRIRTILFELEHVCSDYARVLISIIIDNYNFRIGTGLQVHR